MTDNDGGFETPHTALINRLIEAADHDQDGGIMLTPEGHPIAAIWPERQVDRFGTETWVIHILTADSTTTVETSHLQ